MTPPSRPWRQRLRRWALLLGIVYLGVVGLLVLFENELVYMPGSAARWTEPAGFVAEDVALRSADGTALHAWWIPRDGGAGALLFCHGQMGNLSSRGGLMKRLLKLGMPILIFDYPGFGKSEGDPTEQGCYDAADAAYDWLVEDRKVPPERIVIMGKSLGGGIATDLASRKSHGALVLVMNFTSTPDVAQHLLPFVPARLVMRNRFDNLAKIGRCTGAVYLAHGSCDGKIPPEHARQLYEAAPGPKRLFLMDGLGHEWPCLTDECLDDLAGFLKETLPPGSPQRAPNTKASAP
jgi:pimeloyl-ACP methyl ester carboxylesterase